MTAALTPRQREVLLAIQVLSVPYRQPPSYAEIAEYDGKGVSVVSIHHVVHRLRRKGYIYMAPDKHRTIRVLRPVVAPDLALEAMAAP